MAYHPFRHLGLKFISVVIAVALWFAVAGEQTVERSLRVSLELHNTPAELELVDNVPQNVDIRVRGASSLLSQLDSGDVVAAIDLSSARPGRKLFPLTREHIRVPWGVDVTQVFPGTVSLSFERSSSRTVPVEPTVEGEPAEGYEIVGRRADPAEVRVVGPESALKPLRVAITEPVSVAGATRRVRETVTVGLVDSRLRLDRPVNATVVVDIVPTPVQRALLSVPVRIRNAGAGLETGVVPSVVTVLTRGPKTVIDPLRPDQVNAYVDLAGLGPGRYNLSVRVDTRDFTVVRTDPATVRVNIGR
ncbi:MAG: YbbR-like domain-containing protein [Acidobacteria bacterium]|nr:MAG: YbbR-like domain-containing protein [Acidobacteriota bacterium]RPJ75418.1 MAG: YbbR-like domain-containing protein [Acidobacteriota bacterium]